MRCIISNDPYTVRSLFQVSPAMAVLVKECRSRDEISVAAVLPTISPTWQQAFVTRRGPRFTIVPPFASHPPFLYPGTSFQPLPVRALPPAAWLKSSRNYPLSLSYGSIVTTSGSSVTGYSDPFSRYTRPKLCTGASHLS